jgi:protein-tyrosine phosphatase
VEGVWENREVSNGRSSMTTGRVGFVDVHSHVCPAGDDGAKTVEQGRELCRSAARQGTRILFATPHVWPHLVLDIERERAVRDAFARLAPQAGLDLRLGFELTPATRLLDDDLRRYELHGTGAVLIELPFAGPADLFFRVSERAQEQGLRVIAAHPERTACVIGEPELAAEIAARGWLVQVNGSSLTGWDGPEIEQLGWQFVGDGTASLVASDGHRPTRPPHLDEAHERAVERFGPGVSRLFDGSALGLDANLGAEAAS